MFTKISDKTFAIPGGITLREIILRDPEGVRADQYCTGLKCSEAGQIVATMSLAADGPIGKAAKLPMLNRESTGAWYGNTTLCNEDAACRPYLPKGHRWVITDNSPKSDEAEMEQWVAAVTARAVWVAARRAECAAIALA
jgi:hypothetical protein